MSEIDIGMLIQMELQLTQSPEARGTGVRCLRLVPRITSSDVLDRRLRYLESKLACVLGSSTYHSQQSCAALRLSGATGTIFYKSQLTDVRYALHEAMGTYTYCLPGGV